MLMHLWKQYRFGVVWIRQVLGRYSKVSFTRCVRTGRAIRLNYVALVCGRGTGVPVWVPSDWDKTRDFTRFPQTTVSRFCPCYTDRCPAGRCLRRQWRHQVRNCVLNGVLRSTSACTSIVSNVRSPTDRCLTELESLRSSCSLMMS